MFVRISKNSLKMKGFPLFGIRQGYLLSSLLSIREGHVEVVRQKKKEIKGINIGK